MGNVFTMPGNAFFLEKSFMWVFVAMLTAEYSRI